MTNLYDARPLQKGQKSLTVGTDSQVVELNDPKTSFTNKLIPHLAIYPSLEYSWGTRYNTNYSVSLSFSDGLSFGAKIGLIGKKTPKFGLSIYPKVGAFAGLGELVYFSRTPLLISFYKGEKFSFTYAPVLMLTSQKIFTNSHAAFFNSVNFQTGNKHKFAMSYGGGIFNKKIVSQLSLGYIWRFGPIKP